MNINHMASYLPSYKLLNDLNKITNLHFTIHILKNMLVELSANNYATFDGFTNRIDVIFNASTTYNDKTLIWIMFQN
jgi:hypothetical protein